MKKYIPIQINQEWRLREVNTFENVQPWPFNVPNAWMQFEEKAIATAKPIINHDGREWYDSTDLEEVWQYWSDWEKWTNCGEPSRFKNYDEFKEYWSNGAITTKTRPAWKYIGEKPVENEIAKIVLNLDVIHDREKLIFSKVDVDELVKEERTRIIGIINMLFGHNHPSLKNDLLTKINN